MQSGNASLHLKHHKPMFVKIIEQLTTGYQLALV